MPAREAPDYARAIRGLIDERDEGNIRAAARRAGLKYGTLYDIVRRGVTNPEVGTLTAIAHAYGITLDDLAQRGREDDDEDDRPGARPAPRLSALAVGEGPADQMVRQLGRNAVRKRMPPKERAMAAVEDMFDNLPEYDDSQTEVVLAYLMELAREARSSRE